VKIHAKILTEDDLIDALDASGQRALGVEFDKLTTHKSRSHGRAYDAHLVGDGTTSPYYTNERRHSAGYDAWGWWLAVLFDRDPDAWAGPYKGRDDFHKQTDGKFQRIVRARPDPAQVEWARANATAADPVDRATAQRILTNRRGTCS
jgi:hypothetical protein